LSKEDLEAFKKKGLFITPQEVEDEAKQLKERGKPDTQGSRCAATLGCLAQALRAIWCVATACAARPQEADDL
jgi:hypothetical protein